MRQYFITGTDTDVGKTVASTALVNAFAASGSKVAGHKPISAGCELVSIGDQAVGLRNEDAQLLMAQANVDLPYDVVNPYAFKEPIAPHIAALRTQHEIQMSVLLENYADLANYDLDVLISEGAGGWMLPINGRHTLPDVIKQLDIDIIMVVGMRLGCLNHALLTQQAILSSGLNIVGWIANAPETQPFFDENLATLTARISAPLLGVIPHVQDATSAASHLDISLLNQ